MKAKEPLGKQEKGPAPWGKEALAPKKRDDLLDSHTEEIDEEVERSAKKAGLDNDVKRLKRIAARKCKRQNRTGNRGNSSNSIT